MGGLGTAFVLLTTLFALSLQARGQTSSCPREETNQTVLRRPFSPSCLFGKNLPANTYALCGASGSNRPANSRRLRINAQLLFSDTCQPVPRGILVVVSQANTEGQESAVCCYDYQTNAQGRFVVDTLIPGHYNDTVWPWKERPRVIQFLTFADRDMTRPSCIRQHVTQFYFKDDSQRLQDPCPFDQCHADDDNLVLQTQTIVEGGINIEVANVIIHLKRSCTSWPSTNCQTPEVLYNGYRRASAPCTAPAHLAPYDTAGPFYKTNQPARPQMCTNTPNYATHPAKMRLNLKVQGTDCRPVSGVQIDIWQASQATTSQPVYTDDCRTKLPTNSTGWLSVDTLKPKHYGGRPSHIHFLVNYDSSACHQLLISQVYFPECFDQEELIADCQPANISGRTIPDCSFVITLPLTDACNRPTTGPTTSPGAVTTGLGGTTKVEVGTTGAQTTREPSRGSSGPGVVSQTGLGSGNTDRADGRSFSLSLVSSVSVFLSIFLPVLLTLACKLHLKFI